MIAVIKGILVFIIFVSALQYAVEKIFEYEIPLSEAIIAVLVAAVPCIPLVLFPRPLAFIASWIVVASIYDEYIRIDGKKIGFKKGLLVYGHQVVALMSVSMTLRIIVMALAVMGISAEWLLLF